MPRIRVQPKNLKHSRNQSEVQSGGLTHQRVAVKQQPSYANQYQQDAPLAQMNLSPRGTNLMSLQYKKVERKPRINYEVLIAKAQKKLNSGEDSKQQVRAVEYEAARPDHRFDTGNVAMRQLYTEIVTKGQHSLQYD